MSLGTNIRALRKAKGLTLEEVGAPFGIKRASVAAWESGDTRPDLDRLVGLARLFGVTVDYLLTGDASRQPPASIASAKLMWPFTISKDRFDELPERERNRIDRFVTDTVENWDEANHVGSRKTG